MRRRAVAVAGLCLLAIAGRAAAQVPEKFENLKVLPQNISRDELRGIMRNFAMGLGVRCEYCHEEEPNFKADTKPTKEKARVMLRMVGYINDSILTKLQNRADPPVRVGCVTCHRGSPVPRTLDQVLNATIARAGVDSAIAQYRKLRDESLPLGRYNFGEQTLLEVARTLGAAGKNADAIRVLLLNQEFYPSSPQIMMQLGDAYRASGDNAKAIENYRKVLEKQPNNAMAKRRLQELGVQ